MRCACELKPQFNAISSVLRSKVNSRPRAISSCLPSSYSCGLTPIEIRNSEAKCMREKPALSAISPKGTCSARCASIYPVARLRRHFGNPEACRGDDVGTENHCSTPGHHRAPNAFGKNQPLAFIPMFSAYAQLSQTLYRWIATQIWVIKDNRAAKAFARMCPRSTGPRFYESQKYEEHHTVIGKLPQPRIPVLSRE